jgi:hypothetical protein
MINLETGEATDMYIKQGAKVTVPSKNTMYLYQNLGKEDLVIRDECPQFDPSNEPSAEDVFVAIRSVAGL